MTSELDNRDTALRVVNIVEGTSVDGPGLRTSIYFAGCDHHCPGCHNPTTWAHDAGRSMTIDEIMYIVIENDFNVTFSGGDPVYQLSNLLPLARRIRDLGKTIWLYTGFTFEELWAMPRCRELLELVDVVVDGPFIESERDISLRFRGSRNQRLVLAAESRPGAVSLWPEG